MFFKQLATREASLSYIFGCASLAATRSSGLNLVTAAIVLWNTVYLERASRGLP